MRIGKSSNGVVAEALLFYKSELIVFYGNLWDKSAITIVVGSRRAD